MVQCVHKWIKLLKLRVVSSLNCFQAVVDYSVSELCEFKQSGSKYVVELKEQLRKLCVYSALFVLKESLRQVLSDGWFFVYRTQGIKQEILKPFMDRLGHIRLIRHFLRQDIMKAGQVQLQLLRDLCIVNVSFNSNRFLFRKSKHRNIWLICVHRIKFNFLNRDSLNLDFDLLISLNIKSRKTENYHKHNQLEYELVNQISLRRLLDYTLCLLPSKSNLSVTFVRLL